MPQTMTKQTDLSVLLSSMLHSYDKGVVTGITVRLNHTDGKVWLTQLVRCGEITKKNALNNSFLVGKPGYCHNPTNNPKQLKTTFVGVVLLSVKNPTTTTTPHHHNHVGCDYNSGSSRQPKNLIFGMQLYFNPTRRNMEDNLHFFQKGRRPHFF